MAKVVGNIRLYAAAIDDDVAAQIAAHVTALQQLCEASGVEFRGDAAVLDVEPAPHSNRPDIANAILLLQRAMRLCDAETDGERRG